MKPVTRKRLEWIVAMATLTGDVHYERWPDQGPWSSRDYRGRSVRNGPRRKHR